MAGKRVKEIRAAVSIRIEKSRAWKGDARCVKASGVIQEKALPDAIEVRIINHDNNTHVRRDRKTSRTTLSLAIYPRNPLDLACPIVSGPAV